MEKKHVFNRFVITIFLFISIILLGAYFYSSVEGWSYFNSVYFTTITVTTIGYGDFAPATFYGRLFTLFFPFIGIGMAFYLLSVIGNYFFTKTIRHVAKNRK